MLPLCETIYISDQCLYNYFIRSKESLVSKFYDKKFEVCIRFDKTIQEFQRVRGIGDDQSMQEINYMYLKSILSCETNLFLPSCPYPLAEKKEMCIRDRYKRIPNSGPKLGQRLNHPYEPAIRTGIAPMEICGRDPVSYTHLDVYKRQITYLSSPCEIAETGHSASHAPQEMQSSPITYAMIHSPIS